MQQPPIVVPLAIHAALLCLCDQMRKRLLILFRIPFLMMDYNFLILCRQNGSFYPL